MAIAFGSCRLDRRNRNPRLLDGLPSGAHFESELLAVVSVTLMVVALACFSRSDDDDDVVVDLSSWVDVSLGSGLAMARDMFPGLGGMSIWSDRHRYRVYQNRGDLMRQLYSISPALYRDLKLRPKGNIRL